MTEQFWHDLAEWSEEAFGPTKDRGPLGPLKHLAKEVQEAIAEPANIEEYADLQFLVFDAARRAGFSWWQLQCACWNKLGINKTRKWPKPTSPDEPVEHNRCEK